MNLLSQSDFDLLQVNRAIGDLRLGMPVLIDHRYLVLATETASKETFEQVRSKVGQVFYVTSSYKAFFPMKENGSDLVFCEVSNCAFDELEELSDYHQLDDSLFEQDSVYSAFKLMKFTGLLPTFLICNITDPNVIASEARQSTQTCTDGTCGNGLPRRSKELLAMTKEVGFSQISKIDSQMIKKYYFHINNDWHFVADADLKLKHALNAKIVAFRSKFVPYEHYAIIVGDITKVKVPYVRIHSSCYTGDLMASLSCDCRDQLMEAIKYMGSDPSKAGVILYLMQEGRGIGLTNKIRTYKLQQQGYDTVEANHYLGFEDDERVFDVAFSMLKYLGINTIKLLTNNPKKEEYFCGTGIEVEEVVSVFGDVNEHNESYLAAKKNRMGHRF